MRGWRDVAGRLLFIPLWLMLPLTALCAVLLVLVFVNGLQERPVAYAVYVLSFYTLSVLCLFCYKALPDCVRRARGWLYSTRYGNRFMTDTVFKTTVMLYVGLAVNILYAGAYVLFSFQLHSAWYHIFAVYYAIIAIMRFLLLRFVNKKSIGENPLDEWKRARACAAILTLINLSVSAAVLMILYQGRGMVYEGVFIYVVAAYTFYMTTVSIINMVKYRKYQSPVLSAVKIISLATALVSMLMLETAMLASFGAQTAEETKRALIAGSGAGISAIILGLSSYMIVKSTREISKLNKERVYDGQQ